MSDQGSPATPRTEAAIPEWLRGRHDHPTPDAAYECESGLDTCLPEKLRAALIDAAEAREDAAAPGLREALVEWWALWDADGPESGKHRTDPLTIPGDMRERHTALLAAGPAAAEDARPPTTAELRAVREEMRSRIEAWRNTRVGRILPHATDRILEPLDALIGAPATADTEGAVREAINDPIDGYDAFLDRQDMAR